MRSPRALVVLGIVATVLSGLGLVVVLVVLLNHNLHPPHVDADLWLGVVGLIVGFAALGGSITLLLTGRARMREQPAGGPPLASPTDATSDGLERGR